jgi:hypothetical protein
VALDGTITDDGLPDGAAVSAAWSVQSGPAGATFADVNAVDTTVTFVSDGTYVLELTADDTALQGTDTVTIIVEAAPALTAIAVTPSDAALFIGGTQAFTASGTDQYGDPIALTTTWTADGGTIDAGGNYTAGGTTGSFTVTATDGLVSGTANVTISVDIAPSAPVGLTASGDDGQVSLDWADNPEPDLTAAPYRVYRSEIQGVLGTELAASPFNTSDHIDTTVINGTTYYYVVTAEDAGGNVSANSAEVATTPNGPVHAYWTLDENAGITIADTIAPNDGSGTINGAEWIAGISGSALDFNGIGDNVVIDNTPQLHITGKAISMHAWVFPRDGAVTASQKIISKYNDGGIRDTFSMMIQDYRLRFRLDDELMISSHIITLNEWVHVAMVYDGTDMRIYVNGVLDAATPLIKSDPIDASTRAVHLGRREGEGNLFDGIIDEVQILNSVLIPGVVTPPARGAGLFFEDISLAAGVVSPILGGHGVMFAEVNNDSMPDFYITNNRENNSDRPDFYYENTNGAAFAEVQEARGIDDTDGGSHGAVWADLDNDGDYDLINGTTWDNANPNPGNPESDNVFENTGTASGSFEERTPASILAVEIETNGITAFDMDGDGDLDLFGVPGDTGTPGVNAAFLNNGNFAFSSHEGGVLSTAVGMLGVTDTDYDGDGDIDILAANNTGDFAILNNNGAGVFSQIPPSTLNIFDSAGSGISTADVDNDGDLDLLLVSIDNANLYTREDDGSYVKKQTFTLFEGFMGGFADLDNDGYLDLVLAGDEKVFLNDGSGTFVEDQSVPVSEIKGAQAIAFADIDSDGDLDFAIAATETRPALVRNDIDSAGGNWLRVELVSPQCQAGAFGAKVFVRPAGDAVTLIGMREAKGNVGYLAQDDPVLHFGLGAFASVDVIVEFVDGSQVTRLNESANTRILIDECPSP